MRTVEWPRNSGRIYTCERYTGDVVKITAKPGRTTHTAIAGEPGALRWLCDRSLRKSKAQKLIDSVLRPVEEFAT